MHDQNIKYLLTVTGNFSRGYEISNGKAGFKTDRLALLDFSLLS